MIHLIVKNYDDFSFHQQLNFPYEFSTADDTPQCKRGEKEFF